MYQTTTKTISLTNCTNSSQNLPAMPTTPTRTEWLKAWAAIAAFTYIHSNWIGRGYTPSSGHILYIWTAFWTGCCFFCTYFANPWPYVAGHIASTGLLKNLGMLWSSYPTQGTDSTEQMMEVWLPWIAGFIVTALAFGCASYRAYTVRWSGDADVGSIRFDEEAV